MSLRRALIVLPLLFGAALATPGVGHAQSFKSHKFDIKGDTSS